MWLPVCVFPTPLLSLTSARGVPDFVTRLFSSECERQLRQPVLPHRRGCTSVKRCHVKTLFHGSPLFFFLPLSCVIHFLCRTRTVVDSWLCFPKLEAAKPDRISLSGIASVDMAARGFFFFFLLTQSRLVRSFPHLGVV